MCHIGPKNDWMKDIHWVVPKINWEKLGWEQIWAIMRQTIHGQGWGCGCGEWIWDRRAVFITLTLFKLF